MAWRAPARVTPGAGEGPKGGPSFGGGADLGEPPGSARLRASSDATDRERRHVAQLGLRACRAIEEAEAVTLARIHGHAIGGGLALALACDFRIAAAGAALPLPEVDPGVPLAWGATPRFIQGGGAGRGGRSPLPLTPQGVIGEGGSIVSKEKAGLLSAPGIAEFITLLADRGQIGRASWRGRGES